MKYSVFVLCVGLVLFSVERAGFGIGLRPFFEKFSLPFIQTSGRFHAFIYAPFIFLDSAQHAEQENENLRVQRAELLRILDDKSYEEAIASEKKLSFRKDTRFIQSIIIGSEQPVVSVGSLQGIDEGAMVTSHEALVGIITHVGAQFSQVELLSNLMRKMQVRVREIEVEGLLEKENGELVLSHIRPDAKLAVGQLVTTFGSSEGVLPYVPIGKVKQLLGSPSDPFQRAAIELLMFPKDGTVVSILQNREVP